MKLTVTGRHIEITEAIRTYVEKKVEKLRKYSDGLFDVHVIMEVEKKGQSVEITLNGAGCSLNSKETTADMYESIDKSVDKMESQLKKHREKIKARKTTACMIEEIEESELIGEPEEKIVSRRKIDGKPISVEEAIIHLETTKAVFCAFINQETGRVNVLYVCGAGRFKLIES
ncbi:ribosome-associated translation inhibitor RaiA [Candidatus Desantisbacteria bacterium]|nr:ribosome-associated translation inhibitor RaiA [Candidatus Desantisbacteria bacterium]